MICMPGVPAVPSSEKKQLRYGMGFAVASQTMAMDPRWDGSPYANIVGLTNTVGISMGIQWA